MPFLHPALLAGALLFAVPLIIHLLNRQRHKRRPWAAMEFLLRAYQKQRNRLRNENLLLLLLRCLVPIVLALAIARPLLRQVSGLLAGAGIVHHVVLLDGTYSMGLRQDGGQTPFERARGLAGRLLDRFEQNPNRSDKVTLVLAGVRPRFVVRGDLDLAAARAGWLLLQKPEDAAGDLTEALRQVGDALEEANDPLAQVYVLTDLQARAFGKSLAKPDQPGGPELTDTLRDAVERIARREGTELHWIDVGPTSTGGQGGAIDNTQLVDLRLSDPAAVQKSPAEIVATLKNRGETTATCEVTLEVDGGEPMRKLVTVPPGSEGEADFQLTFREAGRRRVRASLVQDVLAADDERFLTVEVRDRIRILLVDGAAAGDPLQSYAYLWRSMLDPDPDTLPTFAVDSVDVVALLGGQCSPKDYDVVVLADVERLNNRATAALVDALRAGRGLLCMFGPRAEVDSYNLHLYAAGEGPMPFRLLPPLGGPQGSAVVRSPSITAPEHPLLREFEEDVYREILQAIPIWRWHGVVIEPPPDAAVDPTTVLARVTDADQTPLLVTRPFGEGSAVFLTSPIGSEYDADRWNDLNNPLVAFPLLHGLVKWLALPAKDPFAAPVGGELSCSLPARPQDVQLQRPERDGRSTTPIGDEVRPLPGGRFALPPFHDTIQAGFYVFDMVLDRETGKQPLVLPFAVNVDPDEGELRYPTHAEASAALGIERVLDALPQTSAVAEDPDQSELGPSLLLATLLLVLGEAALARFVAVRRS